MAISKRLTQQLKHTLAQAAVTAAEMKISTCSISQQECRKVQS